MPVDSSVAHGLVSFCFDRFQVFNLVAFVLLYYKWKQYLKEYSYCKYQRCFKEYELFFSLTD